MAFDTRRESTAALPLPRFNDWHESGLPAAHFAVSTMDDCGRLAERSALRHLGWHCGQAIDFVVVDGTVVISRCQRSRYVLAERDYLRIPADVRACARINRDDRLLLVAICELGTLLIYTPAQAVAALKEFSPLAWRQL